MYIKGTKELYRIHFDKTRGIKNTWLKYYFRCEKEYPSDTHSEWCCILHYYSQVSIVDKITKFILHIKG